MSLLRRVDAAVDLQARLMGVPVWPGNVEAAAVQGMAEVEATVVVQATKANGGRYVAQLVLKNLADLEDMERGMASPRGSRIVDAYGDLGEHCVRTVAQAGRRH